jgi:4-hydroxy-tetrahydrodipicolinate reductase
MTVTAVFLCPERIRTGGPLDTKARDHMTITIILGNGGLGRAVEAALLARTAAADASPSRVRLLGRPAAGRHAPDNLAGADVLVEASRADAVVANLAAGLEAGVRRAVIATTGWEADHPSIESLLREYGAAAVAASNFSLGVVLFGRLVEAAVELFGPLDGFDPYLLEWHRRTKRDRPSGTAIDLARRIVAAHPRLHAPDDLEVVSIRAGASPGMHLVGFDAAGENIELRLTARDRSAYAAGILAAADWLVRAPREPGLHPFDPIVDELVARDQIAA